MSFFELAKSRWSVRAYKDTPIEAEKMQLILEAGRVAPTAKNYQPQRIYVAKSEEARKKLASVCRCTWDAPVILVVCYDTQRHSCNKLMNGYGSGEKDASIVCTHMMLQAWELGIGSCWVMHFDPGAMKKAFNIPDNYEAVALLVMGYPAEDAKPLPLHSQYRPEEEVVFYESF